MPSTLTFRSFVSSESFNRRAEQCPLTISEWESRSSMVKCQVGHTYHCLMTLNGTYIEACLSVRVLEAEDGCPVLEYSGTFPQIKQMPCKPDINTCPNKGNGQVLSDELYKYPLCLKATEDTDERGFTSPNITTFTIASATRKTKAVTSSKDEDSSYLSLVHREQTLPMTNEEERIYELTTAAKTTVGSLYSKLIYSTTASSLIISLKPRKATDIPQNRAGEANIVSFDLIIGVSVGSGLVLLVLIIVPCTIIYVQHMKNKRYKMNMERVQYLPSIPNAVDSMHPYRDIDVYDDIEEIDIHSDDIGKDHAKNRSRTDTRSSQVVITSTQIYNSSNGENYDDFLGIKESDSSSSGYLEPTQASPKIKNLRASSRQTELQKNPEVILDRTESGSSASGYLHPSQINPGPNRSTYNVTHSEEQHDYIEVIDETEFAS